MMGKKTEQPPLFYYINIRNMIPKNHILRLINKYIDFSFIRKRAKHLYSSTGRPSIDPEVLLRMLLIGYLYGIASERRLCEEVSMHVGYRWFTGLNLDDKVPDHSTFSKNRHNRFKESGIFQSIFDEIVERCIDKGLVSAEHLSVDGSLIKANASIGSMEPIVVKMSTAEYADSLERENRTDEEDTDIRQEIQSPSVSADSGLSAKTEAALKDKREDTSAETIKKDRETKEGKETSHSNNMKQKDEKISNKTHRSKTDPDAKLARKSHTETKLSHLLSYRQ